MDKRRATLRRVSGSSADSEENRAYQIAVIGDFFLLLSVFQFKLRHVVPSFVLQKVAYCDSLALLSSVACYRGGVVSFVRWMQMRRHEKRRTTPVLGYSVWSEMSLLQDE